MMFDRAARIQTRCFFALAGSVRVKYQFSFFFLIMLSSQNLEDFLWNIADLLRGPQETGTRRQEDESVPLSQLVEVLNDRLGTQFTLADQLFFDQIV